MNEQERKTNYRAFFIIGISLMVPGICIGAVNPALIVFSGCGAVFMIIGLANRDEWKKPKDESQVSSTSHKTDKAYRESRIETEKGDLGNSSLQIP